MPNNVLNDINVLICEVEGKYKTLKSLIKGSVIGAAIYTPLKLLIDKIHIDELRKSPTQFGITTEELLLKLKQLGELQFEEVWTTIELSLRTKLPNMSDYQIKKTHGMMKSIWDGESSMDYMIKGLSHSGLSGAAIGLFITAVFLGIKKFISKKNANK